MLNATAYQLYKIEYVNCRFFLQICNISILKASLVHNLIKCYKLLENQELETYPSENATEDELKYFHSSSYINFLKKVYKTEENDDFEEEELEYGLSYDCSLVERTYDVVKTIGGSSLTAAKLLLENKCDVCINWCGGWHHAQRYLNLILQLEILLNPAFRDSAEGFCYVNDVVLAIQKMTEKFEKILYIDLDVHHGLIKSLV